MPRGVPPTNRPRGRPKNSRNKATIERERVAAEIAQKTVADARVAGKKLGKEVLDEFMHLFAGMAAAYQPAPPGMEIAPSPGRRPDEAKFEKYALLAIGCARDLARYQSPTFQAIQIAPPPPPPGARRFTLTIFENNGREVKQLDVMPPEPKRAGSR